MQSLLPCSQKDCASLTHWGARAPCPVGCHPKSRAVLFVPMAALSPSLAPKQLRVSGPMPPVQPHAGGAVVVSVLPWEITATLDSTPNQTRGAHHSGSTRTSLQIFEQFIVPGICTKT